MVIKDRPELTIAALNSIYFSGQPSDSYDLFLIDNGSNPSSIDKLKQHMGSSPLAVKNLICMPEVSIGEAWNLFLALSRHYEYRTKVDNDLVLAGTLVPQVPKERDKKPKTPPPNAEDYGSNPGAIPSLPPLTGIGGAAKASARRKALVESQHTKFLQHLENFGRENSADLVSLITVSPKKAFIGELNAAVAQQWKGLPYLTGGCMMISKKCFDTLGYFHEKMPRRIDIEYSQRAIKNMLNIGYHPYYYAHHSGAGQSTEPHQVVAMKQQKSLLIEDNEPIQAYGNSVWEDAVGSIEDACLSNRILNLS